MGNLQFGQYLSKYLKNEDHKLSYLSQLSTNIAKSFSKTLLIFNSIVEFFQSFLQQVFRMCKLVPNLKFF